MKSIEELLTENDDGIIVWCYSKEESELAIKAKRLISKRLGTYCTTLGCMWRKWGESEGGYRFYIKNGMLRVNHNDGEFYKQDRFKVLCHVSPQSLLTLLEHVTYEIY